jgi:hypothetical protein
MYSALVLSILTLWLWLRRLNTGLKWDAACIADQIALIKGSNILDRFHGLEFATKTEMRDVLSEQATFQGFPRLGYWRHVEHQNTFWHGIAMVPFPKGQLPIRSSLYIFTE